MENSWDSDDSRMPFDYCEETERLGRAQKDCKKRKTVECREKRSETRFMGDGQKEGKGNFDLPP